MKALEILREKEDLVDVDSRSLRGRGCIEYDQTSDIINYKTRSFV